MCIIDFLFCAAFYWNIGQVVLGTKLVHNRTPDLRDCDLWQVSFDDGGIFTYTASRAGIGYVQKVLRRRFSVLI